MSETDETAGADEIAAEGAIATDEAAPEAVATETEPADEVEAPAEEAPVEEIAVAEEPAAPAPISQASIFVCERGHRTFSVWSTPTTCRAHVNRRDECGRQLYPLGELPEQVQKALNPLKASKKSSKKG